MYQIRSGTGCGETLRCSKRSPLSLHGWCQMQPFFMQAMNHQMLRVEERELLSKAPARHRPAYVASLISWFWSQSVSCVVCLSRRVNFETGICIYHCTIQFLKTLNFVQLWLYQYHVQSTAVGTAHTVVLLLYAVQKEQHKTWI